MSQHSVYTPENSYEENALKEAMDFLKEQLEDGSYLSDSDIFKFGLFHLSISLGFRNIPLAYRWMVEDTARVSSSTNQKGWE